HDQPRLARKALLRSVGVHGKKGPRGRPGRAGRACGSSHCQGAEGRGGIRQGVLTGGPARGSVTPASYERARRVPAACSWLTGSGTLSSREAGFLATICAGVRPARESAISVSSAATGGGSGKASSA